MFTEELHSYIDRCIVPYMITRVKSSTLKKPQIAMPEPSEKRVSVLLSIPASVLERLDNRIATAQPSKESEGNYKRVSRVAVINTIIKQALDALDAEE